MKEPILVVMAAGMGSRYGGLKQIDPIGPNGELIIDYSIYDAARAGFKKVVFVIKRELEKTFHDMIGDRVSSYIQVSYAYQELTDLPDGFTVPEGRTKPWGTAHAVLSARHIVDGPFAVINSDDFYGRGAFTALYDYLKNVDDDKTDVYPFAMAGYTVENTLTENGHVARGVCQVSDDGYLTGITERTRIEKTEEGAHFTEDDGHTWTDIPEGSIVSMNTWAFTSAMMRELEARFPAFLKESAARNPLKSEYFLPTVVGTLIAERKASVTVLKVQEKWYGVTYKEDKPNVEAAIAAMIGSVYPEKL